MPLVLIIMGMMALGCGIIVSSLTTKYRDLSIVVTFGVSLWMYATPVVYPLSLSGDGLMRKVLLINPVTQLMEIFRYMMLGQGTISIAGIIWSVAFSVIVLLGGIMLFKRVEKTFMDTV
ncbi:MAG: ABC transporter permease [Saccharofermentans sp.]|nr:ABC transporter permease [Saccharofermentans sp.]